MLLNWAHLGRHKFYMKVLRKLRAHRGSGPHLLRGGDFRFAVAEWSRRGRQASFGEEEVMIHAPEWFFVWRKALTVPQFSEDGTVDI